MTSRTPWRAAALRCKHVELQCLLEASADGAARRLRLVRALSARVAGKARVLLLEGWYAWLRAVDAVEASRRCQEHAAVLMDRTVKRILKNAEHHAFRTVR